MNIRIPHKIGTLLLTFQKKKLYYNRISQSQLYLPFRVIAYVSIWAQLTIEQNSMFIKRSFLMLILIITLLGTISSKQNTLNFDSNSAQNRGVEIQLEKQAKNILTPKKETTPFYQFKFKNAKTYNNFQEEVYRSIVYIKNQQKINKNNQKVDRKFNMAMNRFADLTPLEFSEIYTTLYNSNQQVKGYTKKLIDSQNFYDPTNTLPINQSNFIKNNLKDFRAVKDRVIQQISDKKTNVWKQNQEFNIVEEVFASSNPQTLFRQNRNKATQSVFDSYQMSNTIASTTIAGLNLQLGTVPSAESIIASVQQQLNKILQSTASITPLKLTNDTTVSTTSSTTALTTSTGNFTSTPIDWTVHAGKIRYQGICGACYTFATSDVVGSLYSIYKFGFFVPLSTQQVVDCSTNGLTYGCNGGFLEGSYAYMQVKGIVSDVNYPYISANSGLSGTCKKEGGTFKVASFKNIELGNCKALVNQLNYGPVSIGIAGYRLQFYSTGIFNDCNSYIDHAVVLISYKGGVGWKIKNSWGSDWGMNGFAWIADGNNCGICNMAVSAKI